MKTNKTMETEKLRTLLIEPISNARNFVENIDYGGDEIVVAGCDTAFQQTCLCGMIDHIMPRAIIGWKLFHIYTHTPYTIL